MVVGAEFEPNGRRTSWQALVAEDTAAAIGIKPPLHARLTDPAPICHPPTCCGRATCAVPKQGQLCHFSAHWACGAVRHRGRSIRSHGGVRRDFSLNVCRALSHLSLQGCCVCTPQQHCARAQWGQLANSEMRGNSIEALPWIFGHAHFDRHPVPRSCTLRGRSLRGRDSPITTEG